MDLVLSDIRLKCGNGRFSTILGDTLATRLSWCGVFGISG